MPTFILETNLKKIASKLESSMHDKIRKLVASITGKSEDFVLTVLKAGIAMKFGPTDEPCAYCEIKSVGALSPENTQELSSLLCVQISKDLKIDPTRIYLEFQESAGHMWGWNGRTFAR